MLEDLLPAKLLSLLDKRDAHAQLLEKFPEAFSPESVSVSSAHQQAWEYTGLYYMHQNRFYESLSIFKSLYDHMFLAQDETNQWVHKGMPLCWISDCYSSMGFSVLSKRYIMLTLCEDAIRMEGNISPDKSGVYFRLVWKHGLSDSELKSYARKAYDLWKEKPDCGLYPEWILQSLDKQWMVEFPTPQEAAVYTVNSKYVKNLLSKLGTDSGQSLEWLADYVLSCMPGCKATRRQRSMSTDYDVVCSMEGFELDFRSEFGRYFVCECKDWNRSADFTTIAKFCRVLDSTKSKFGIIFSKQGISGQKSAKYAGREQLKVFQDRGMVIIVVDENDLTKVASGSNFINILRQKYERVRLDLSHAQNNDRS